jgi:hypothetical protein
MTPNIANSIRNAATLPALQWFKARVLGGPQFSAMVNALHAAMFFGFSYVGMTIVTGWAQQIMAAADVSERQ